MGSRPLGSRLLRAAGVASAMLAVPVWLASGEAGDRFDELLRSGRSLYSQGKEELIIRHFFRDRRDGFFVDVGCYHWKRISTTYYLEKHLDWSGIAVDALEHFGPGWRANRPRSKFFAYAVTDRSGERIRFYTAMAGLSSTELEAVEAWRKDRPHLEPRAIEVPTITIDDLLDREGVTKIDFLSMDINGGEVAALAGFDVKRFRPELVHIEIEPKHREAVTGYFERNGYRRIDAYLKHDPVNWYFTPKG